jgi:hypothetical protein
LLETERDTLVTVAADNDARELVLFHHTEANARILLNLRLKALCKLLVTLGGNHRQRIRLEATHAVAVLIYTKAQATANCLPQLRSVLMSRRVKLEHIGNCPILPLARV